MFQIWLGSFRSCRARQAPAQRLTSSNKEQVGHELVLLCRFTCSAIIAVLTFDQQGLLKPHIFRARSHKNTCCIFKWIQIFCLSHKQACNVLYLNSVETESLTGPEAVSKATKCTLALSPRPVATVVHFKVSSQGITLTDSKRRYILDTTILLPSNIIPLSIQWMWRYVMF